MTPSRRGIRTPLEEILEEQRKPAAAEKALRVRLAEDDVRTSLVLSRLDVISTRLGNIEALLEEADARRDADEIFQETLLFKLNELVS